ncbi:TspO/MBR family protein [Bosea minatitlanensis]|uniref:TspO/MBR family protein n=1 Tax=Bosea minatitlanensis TaxID=128782 RepID=A0ABW0F3W8_9HYPH|nr:TspO/MBR family protein [Bosea minatitlanensis]MCT4494204.1 tryptophan-rich sensory protein [Bosea minatitlanensis]
MTTLPGLSTERRPPLWAALLIAIVPVVAASLLGSAATVPQIAGWYAGLAKPPFNPPNWIFAPVWTALFALMALAVFRILRVPVGQPGRRRALLAYHLQLLLNVAWSFAFFGANSPLAGLAVILPLLAAILATIAAFRPLDRLASNLLWPYLAWVGFATLLNASIWWLNR